jgi:transposase-like protein
MITRFEWTQKRTSAALALARGLTREQVASDVGIVRKTLYNWTQQPEFAQEIDRLSSMIDISARAERMRIAMRAIRQKVKGETVETNRDLLDWLRFAQSETQGVNLGLAKLAE